MTFCVNSIDWQDISFAGIGVVDMGEEENSCQQERIFRFWEQAQIIVHLAFYYSLILIGDFPFYLFIYFWEQLQNTSLFGHLHAFKRTIHFESISSFLHAPAIPHTPSLPQLSCSCYFSAIKLLRGIRKCPSDCSLCAKSLDIFYISSKNTFKLVIVHVCKQFLSFKCSINGTKEHFV